MPAFLPFAWSAEFTKIGSVTSVTIEFWSKIFPVPTGFDQRPKFSSKVCTQGAVFFIQDGTSNCQRDRDCHTQEDDLCLGDGLCGVLDCVVLCYIDGGGYYKLPDHESSCEVNEWPRELCEPNSGQTPRVTFAVIGNYRSWKYWFFSFHPSPMLQWPKSKRSGQDQ